MAPKRYPAHVDHGVIDFDRRGDLATKKAAMVGAGDYDDRAQERSGLRELDTMVEAMPGLTRQQKDRDRIMPRATVADLGHTRMERRLPSRDDIRTPFSSRQKKARSKTRIAVTDRLPKAQYESQRQLLTSRETWSRVNDALSKTSGDVQALPEKDQQLARRVDRSIQAYEKQNNRGHVVYANVEMPHFINRSNLEAFLDNNLDTGERISFDRYTFGTHQLHETVGLNDDPAGRRVVFEIQTRRGAYLGHSDSEDDTSHVLPRGTEYELLGHHEANYRRPDGSTDRVMVIQARSVEEGQEGEPT